MKRITELADLTGRVCVITGGAGHLGQAVAEAYLEAGATVVIVDRAIGGCSDLFGRPAYADRLRFEACNLAITADIRDVAARIQQSHERIDVLVNNAAFVGTSAAAGWQDTFEKQTVELYTEALGINLVAPFVLSQALLPALQRSSSAAIINVGSIYGMVGPDWDIYAETNLGSPAGYAASKGGLLQLTRWMATTLSPGIRVNAFCPGGIEKGQDPRFQARYVGKTPLGRMATPEDFKGVALFLASDLSAYVTGQVIAVDGGWTAW